jgi:iron complex outermembrane recepter protein
MKKLCLLFIISLLALSQSQAQKIYGTIKDETNKETLIGATVAEKGTTNATRTDFNGKFELNVSNPTATLVITFLGYETKEFKLSAGKTYYTFEVPQATTVTQEIVINSSRLSEKLQESPVTVERLNIAAIKETPAMGFYEGLSNLKGVDMTSASLGFKIINTRGFNSTSPVRTLQVIDGMDNQAPGLNFSLGNFVGASEIDIESVDIVVGANSATYGPNAFNGVINMTTKDPFKYPGLIVQVKGANRNLFEGAVRYAKVSKNNKFAFKVNAYYLTAQDFIADNYEATGTSFNEGSSPYGSDRVNIYGDEALFAPYQRDLFKELPAGDTLKKFVYRRGYREIDLINPHTESLKLNGGLYYKLNPNLTASYFYNLGTGSTIYQGDNRYAIKNIVFQQHKAELNGKSFNFRAYTTLEDAGDSYDIVFTAYKLLQSVKSNQEWIRLFEQSYTEEFRNDCQCNPNSPSSLNPDQEFTPEKYNAFIENLEAARRTADGNFLEPGTPEFQEAFNKITSTASFIPTSRGDVGGTKFQDQSNLKHIEASKWFNLSESIWKPLPEEFKIGMSYRQFNPQSFGTIFSDTLKDRNDVNSGFTKISVWEVGMYASAEKKVLKEKGKFIGAIRRDHHQNYAPTIFYEYYYLFGGNPNFNAAQSPNVSPALSFLYTYKRANTFRLTYSGAIRNPTLQDQYLFYNIGRALLRGNIDGFGNDRFILVSDYFNKYLKGELVTPYNVPAIRPERVRTLEFGFKGIIRKKLYVDASVYRSVYRDFLGNVLLISNPLGSNGTDSVIRVAANSISKVIAQGFSIGLNYYFPKYHSIGFNYTYAPPVIITDPNDPIIPGYNTPRHKYNVTYGARGIKKKYGYNITYKWVEGFEFTGSPQFTGSIPSYGLLDVQVNYKWIAYNTVFKLGSSNILNNKHFEAYGATRIGQIVYLSANFEI